MGRAGQLQMWNVGWINAYLEGDAFVQLLYGGNIGQTNYSRFKLPEYDRLYEKARGMPPGPERDAVMQQMGELVNAYAPWNLSVFRYENVLVHPWVVGYKYNGYSQHPWQYYDIDLERRRAASR
jgi:ABC-type transport system substrate-binding protein